MSKRPDCQNCPHNFLDHNDYWDSVGSDGITPNGVKEGACAAGGCSCPGFAIKEGQREDNPAFLAAGYYLKPVKA